jgi:hypothetical protein
VPYQTAGERQKQGQQTPSKATPCRRLPLAFECIVFCRHGSKNSPRRIVTVIDNINSDIEIINGRLKGAAEEEGGGGHGDEREDRQIEEIYPNRAEAGVF